MSTLADASPPLEEAAATTPTAAAAAASLEDALKSVVHPPLLARDIIAHPAFQHLEWKLPPTRSGRAPVAKGRRGGPFELYWEVHGSGGCKLVWIMGLGAYFTAWKRQTRYFGHTEPHASKNSSLIFDNRGMGRSDKPATRYSTSEMAKDLIDLLEHVGWLDESEAKGDGKERKLHVIGISMGGMIAQELALLIPQSIASLCLVSTAPRIVRTVPFVQNLRERINMFIPRDIDVELDGICHRLFSSDFLQQPDTEPEELGLDREGRAFFTNQDRIAAGELDKRRDTVGFTKKGFIMQAIAAGWHSRNAKDLRKIAESIGRERIAVLHGTADGMLVFKHGEMLEEELNRGVEEGEPKVEFRVWKGVGHVIVWERKDEFNSFVEALIERCQQMR